MKPQKILENFARGVLVGAVLCATSCGAPPQGEPLDTIDAESLEQNGQNSFGLWLWYLQGTGYGSHTALATDLAAIGCKRIYVKVADGAYNATAWPEVNDAALVKAYKDRGIEVWAWAYNYPGSAYQQADALYYAARAGYAGFVSDVEVEFDGKSTELTDLFAELSKARQDAINNGVTTSAFKIYATTWGNPKDHNFRVDIVDKYVDGHMPQTYVEAWGASYMNSVATWIDTGTKEYRSLGAQKPIHHILSAETGVITAAQLNAGLRAAGAEGSIWRIPDGGPNAAIWKTLKGVDWKMTFSPAAAASITVTVPPAINAGVAATFTGTATGGVTQVAASVDGYPIGSATPNSTGAYSLTYTFSAAGSNRSLKVEGKNAAGTVLAQKTVSITVSSAATVTVTVPASITVGSAATFSGTATGGAAKVQLTVDGTSLGEVPVNSGAYSLTYTFSAAGTNRSLKAISKTSAGATLATTTVTITVKAVTGNVPNVPYFYQYNNSNNPGGSCQNTSMAMVLKYYGATAETPDTISNYYGTSQAQTVSGLQSVFNSEAAYFGLSVRDTGTTAGTVTRVRELLAQGRPVIVHGYFTSYGHVIVLLAFDGTNYTAHDPAGKWSQQYGYGGYSGTDPTGGRFVKYAKAAVDQAIAPDGKVWMHEIK